MTTPLVFNSPGVKIRELDFSAYSTGPGASGLGIVGIFERGPVGVPQLVTSFPAAKRIFGNFLSSYYSLYALKQFFDNGGQQAYVTRTAHYTTITDASTLTAVKATLTLVDRAGTPLSTIRIDATGEGTWANGSTGGITVEVVDPTISPTTEFRINVYFNAVLVEVYDNLNLTNTSPDYVETRINGISDYITATNLASATAAPNNRPALLAPASLASGNDGLTSLADTDFIGDSSAKNGIHALDSQAGILFNMVAIPGRSGESLESSLIAYAESLKTVFALLEPPNSLTVANVIAFRKATTPYSGTTFDSSYAALYYPWLKFQDPVTGLTRFFPPTGAVAGMIAASDAIGGVWAGPAGLNRGVLRQVLGLETDITQTEADLLFPQDVNPIVRKEGVGFVVFGQNTLLRRATALDRMNVRRMLIYVETTLKTFAESLLFEPNTKPTWMSFKRFAEPFLSSIRDAQGLNDFQVIVDETNNPPASIDQNRLNIDVYIKPTKTAEFITLTFAVTTQGADFKELFSQG